MTNEYINRNKLLRHLADWWLTESPTGNEILFINGEPQTTPVMKVIEKCMKAVEEQSTADVVEVIRCKDCIYRWFNGVNLHTCVRDTTNGEPIVNLEDFCSYGNKEMEHD